MLLRVLFDHYVMAMEMIIKEAEKSADGSNASTDGSTLPLMTAFMEDSTCLEWNTSQPFRNNQ